MRSCISSCKRAGARINSNFVRGREMVAVEIPFGRKILRGSFYGTADDVVPPDEGDAIYVSAKGRAACGGKVPRAKKVLIDGADHSFGSVRWQQEVVRETVEWLEGSLG